MSSRKGLNVDASDQYPSVDEDLKHFEGDLLLPRADAPMTVRLGGKPLKTHFLTVGPFIAIPLPVIPWPVGMFKAAFGSNRPESLDFQVAVGLNKSARWWRFKGESTTSLTFDPKRTELRVGDRVIQLAAVESRAYTVEPRTGAKKDATSKCISVKQAGEVDFAVADSDCDGMTVTMTFAVPYSDVQSGTLQIGGLEINKAPVAVPTTNLRRGGRFRLWGCCVIND